MFIKNLLLSVCLCLQLMCVFVPVSAVFAQESNDSIPLQAPLPIGEQGTQIENTGSSYFFTYITKVYRWVAGIAGAVAVLMIMVGGFQIAIARGDTSLVDEGKNRIISAITGLALLFTSTIILNTLNPDFYTFTEDVQLLVFEHHKFDDDQPVLSTNFIEPNASQKTSYDFLLYDTNIAIKYKSRGVMKQPPQAIVLHYSVTKDVDTLARVLEKRGENGLACHIGLEKDGKAYQLMLSLEHVSACNPGLNSLGVSVEIIGMSEEELLQNNAQKEGVKKLVNAIAKKYNIPKNNDLSDKKGIFSHQQVDKNLAPQPVQKSDPGEAYMKEILEAIEGTYYDESTKEWSGKASSDT